jgi:hypothetical protein
MIRGNTVSALITPKVLGVERSWEGFAKGVPVLKTTGVGTPPLLRTDAVIIEPG